MKLKAVGSTPTPAAMNLEPIVYPYDPKEVSYAYHLGYTHSKTGLNLWYGITPEEVKKRGLPEEFCHSDYVKGYDEARFES